MRPALFLSPLVFTGVCDEAGDDPLGQGLTIFRLCYPDLVTTMLDVGQLNQDRDRSRLAEHVKTAPVNDFTIVGPVGLYPSVFLAKCVLQGPGQSPATIAGVVEVDVNLGALAHAGVHVDLDHLLGLGSGTVLIVKAVYDRDTVTEPFELVQTDHPQGEWAIIILAGWFAKTASALDYRGSSPSLSAVRNSKKDHKNPLLSHPLSR